MKTKYFLLSISFLFLSASICKAQVSSYTFSQSSGTYTPLVGGTLLGNTASDDQYFVDPTIPLGGFTATGPGLPIGFNFIYNSTTYDRFGIQNNGWIALGQSTLAPAVNMQISNSYTGISGTSTAPPANQDHISVLSRDIQAQAGSTLKFQTTGIAPNRILIVEFTNYRKYFAAGDNYNFQILLYETSNVVQVMYGTMVNNATATTVEVGLRGNSNADFNNRTTTTNWSATTAGTLNSSNCTVSAAVVPTSGLTFTWTPPPSTPMTYVSSTTTQAVTTSVTTGTTNNQVIGIQIITSGTTTPFNLIAVTLNSNGTTNFASDVTNVNIWSTGTSPAFATTTLFGGATNLTLPINGNVVLSSGTNYFWVTYDISATATLGHFIDAECTQLVMTGVGGTQVPTVTAPPGNRLIDYCTPSYTLLCSSGDYIDDFSTTGGLSNITNNLTGCNGQPNNYIFYNTMTVGGFLGSSFNVSMQAGTYPQGFRIWIDWNHNGSFGDPGDDVYNSGTYATTPFTGIINIPNTATLGVTRMRVRCSYFSVPTTTDYCSTLTYGETEDYNMNVVSPPPIDMGATALVSPTANECHSASESVIVTVKNFGTSSIDFSINPLTVNANITGASTQNFSTTVTSGILAPSATQNVTVTTLCNMTANGIDNFACSTSISGDGYTGDDTSNTSIAVGDITILPYTQNFDSPFYGWNVVQIAGTGNWAFAGTMAVPPYLPPNSGSTMAFFDSWDFGFGTISRLSTPCINFTGVMHPALDFYMSQDNGFAGANDRVEIHVSTDGGATYGPIIFTALRYNASPPPSGWLKFSLCLSQFANMPNVKIAFDGVSEFGTAFGVDDVSLYDSPAAIAGTATAVSSSLCPGDSTSISLAGYAGTIQWQSSPNGINFNNISNQTGPTLNTGPLTTTTYYRAFLDTVPCSHPDSSNVITIIVNPKPVVNLGPDITQCGSVLLNAQNPGANYLWSNSSTTQQVTITSTGTYNAIVTNGFGCSNSDTVNVTINPIPVINLGADITQCSGSITLDAQNPGSNYQWSTAATTQTIAVNASGTYAVVVTSPMGCSNADTISVTINPSPVVALGSDQSFCQGNSTTLNAGNPGSNYLWSDGSTNQTLIVNTSGSYSVVVTNSFGCTNSDTVLITVNPLPVVNLGSDITQCGGNVLLDAGNPGSSYVWSNASTNQTLNVSATGTYSVVVTNSNGCSNSDAINITIDPVPIVNLGSDTSICGTTAILDAGNPGDTYLWSNSSTTQSITVNTSGTYSVTVTNPQGCSSSDAIMVTLNTVPIANAGNDTTICIGNSVTLNGNNGFASYLWEFSSFTSPSQSITVTPGSTTTYTLTVTTAAGCTGTDMVTITVDLAPVGSFTYSTSNGNVVTFTNTSTGSSPLTFDWDFGDGSPHSSLANPIHTYSANGNFTVILVVTNSCGSFTYSQIITVTGVGINELSDNGTVNIYPNPSSGMVTIGVSENMEQLFVEIFDLQGKMVYTSMDKNIISGFNKELDLEFLSNGLYSIRINTGSFVETKKLIIAK